MSHLTTHILDATAGVPATGVAVTLAGPDGVAVASGQTDADGRLALDRVASAPAAHADASYFEDLRDRVRKAGKPAAKA